MRDPVYEISKPVIQCDVCFRRRRFWFVTAMWTESVLEQKEGNRPRWRNLRESRRICSPDCAAHFSEFHGVPMYDRYGADITGWLRGWIERQSNNGQAA